VAFFAAGLNQESYDRQYDDGYILRRIASYFRPHRRLVLTIAATLVFFSFTGAITPVIISEGIEALQAESGDALLVLLVLALLVTQILDYVFYHVRRRLTNRVVGDVISQMRKDAFAAAVERDLAFYDDQKSGKVASRITSDTHEFGQVMVISADIFTFFTELLILLIVLLSREWRLTLLLALWMPIFYATALVFRRLARVVTRQGSRAMAAVNDNIQESVAGISVAKNFRREAMIYDEFVQVNRQSYRINL